MSLSQKEFGNLRSLYESVYTPKAETILEGFTDEDLDFTDEYIEEQVEELFIDCIEEGYDIEDIETAICEAVDAELEILTERVDPKETQRRRDQAGGEGSGAAGARAKLNVSKQKVGGSSEKKASALSRVKSAVKKVGSAMKGGVGLAARAVGTAQRAASASKDAAKKGYERGKQGSGGKPSSTSSASGGGSSSGASSSSGTSSASGGSSSGHQVDLTHLRRERMVF